MESRKVTIFGTGGTIAGTAASAGQTTGYEPGVMSVEALMAHVPELGQAAELRSEQLANVGSPDMTSADLMGMAHKIQRELDGGADGVVVTHGTDTLEETAFFLDLTVQSDKPVVVVGAMRPATAHGADGPMNLLCAVKVAASASARGRGTLVVLNDRICSARFATKTNANTVDTFQAVEQGYLGVLVNCEPTFYYPPCRPLGHRHFDVSRRDARAGLPKVAVLYGHLDLGLDLFEAAVQAEYKGVVLAGMGAGCWTTAAGKAIARAVQRTRGLAVVTSRRTPCGFVGGAGNYGLGDSCIGGGFLNPAQCRIQLQLALASGLDRNAIRDVFESSHDEPGPGRGGAEAQAQARGATSRL